MAGAIDTSYFSSDLSFAINDLYTTVTGLASSPVSASVTDLTYASELDIGGEVIKVTQSMIVLASAISVPITIGNLITVGTSERMIASYQQSADKVSYTIEVADPTT
jgi:hypothetical protein